jgi:hypothetical protein
MKDDKGKPQGPTVMLPKVDRSFTIKAQDERGHSVRFQFRASPDMLTRTEEVLVHRQLFGWNTASDFYRWALYRGLQEAARVCADPHLQSAMAIMDMHVQSLQYLHEMARFRRNIDEVVKIVEELQLAGNTAQVRRVLIDTQTRIISMQDTTWRAIHTKEFNRRLGHLMEKLMDVDAEEEEQG